MTVESVTQAVSNLALQFGEEDADPGAMVCNGGLGCSRTPLCPPASALSPASPAGCFLLQSRPFGVALLFGGVDEKGPQL